MGSQFSTSRWGCRESIFLMRNRKLTGWIQRVRAVVKPESRIHRQNCMGREREIRCFMKNLAFAKKK
jgi:hypothetical protein